MFLKPFLAPIVGGFRIARIRLEMRRIDVMRAQALEDLAWAIKFRKYTKEAFVDIRRDTDAQKEALQQRLYAITKEMV